MDMANDGPLTFLAEGQMLQDAAGCNEPHERKHNQADDGVCGVELEPLVSAFERRSRADLFREEAPYVLVRRGGLTAQRSADDNNHNPNP